MAAADSDLRGRRLGEFVIGDRLGRGSHGVVYLAQQPSLGRDAVVKVARGEGNADRFLNEARIASRLDHPYAAHVYAFGCEPDGLRWIAMEHVRGRTLAALLAAHGPLPLDRFVALFERLCEVVHDVHEHGIVHRDVKPDNVMVVSKSGRQLPKLLDLGVAKLAGDDDDRRTGLPRYMPPEQWLGGDVDRRSDIYALGVLAYEALTGRPPFRETELVDLARAHAKAAVPPVGDGLPAELDGLFAAALAKDRAARPATALTLAAALRSAARLEPLREALPQVAEPIRQVWLARAPQPIAEAIAALESATHPHQAWDAAALVARVVVRWACVIALACRRHIGTAPAHDAVTTALRALQRRGLDDADWIALGHGLCAPVPRELHPLPPLHAALCDRRDAIARAAGAFSQPAPIDPGDIAVRLDAVMHCLEELLRELAFVLDTPLAVVRGGRAERWIGLRRRRRIALPIGARAGIRERSVVLLDGDGAPLIVLDPLVQVAPPAPGAEEELFVLDGGDPQGARLVAWPRQYEHHDPELWPWFATHVLESVEEVGTEIASERAPYLGLVSFTAEDAALYHGREAEVEAFRNRLRDETLLAVVGPSGAGKSSFVHAGVVPVLPAGWRAISLRPGRAPVAALTARLVREALLPPGGDISASIAAEVRAHASAPVVLVIDQFEELFTVCRDAAQRERFARALADAADDPEGPIRIVITLRDDFLVAAESLPPLRHRLARGLHVLGTPSSADLRRILVEPARRAGYELADPALADDMVAEVAGEAGALALLSFTAARLWELRDRGFRQLTRRAYESLGGVGGALARHADAVLAAMSPAEQAGCREVFRHLVTAEGTRAAMSRGELAAVLGAEDRARAVVDSLIAARLITAGETERGDDRIEIVHETLIAAWPRLVGWRREDADHARLRDQLRAAARQWSDRGRSKGLLWRGDALLEYELWRHRVPGALPDVEEAFARDSLADAARTRRRQRLAIAGAFAVLAAGLVVLFELRAAAARSAETARDQLIHNYEEQGRRALLDGDAPAALMFLDEAYQMGADGAGLRFMLGRALDPILAETATLAHGARLWSVAFAPDGARAVTGGNDGALAIWDTATARRLFTVPGHGEGVLRAAVSPDGQLIACGGGNGVVEIVRMRDGSRISELRGHGAAIHRVAWFPDGKRVASTSDDGTARIWDLGGAPAKVLRHGPDRPTGLAISRDGSRLATGSFVAASPSADNAPRLWSDGGALIAQLRGHDHPVHSLQFAPAGDRLITAGLDGTARIWDARDGRPLVSLRGHDNAVWDAAFFPDGERAVTASADQTARVWNARTGSTIAILRGHRARLNRVAVTPDGALVITTSADGSARVWDAASGLPISTFAHGGMVFDEAISSRGDALATASWNGTAKLWSLAPRLHAAVFPVIRDAGDADDPPPALSADGRYVARTGPAGLAVWDSAGRPQAAGLGGAITTAPVFAGSLAVAGDRAGHVHAWEPSGIQRLDVAAHARAATAIAATSRGVISSDESGDLAAIDLPGARVRHATLPAPARWLAVAADGSRIAASLDDGRVALLDAADLHAIAVRPPSGPDVELAFSPSGRYLAVSSGQRTEVWRAGDGAIAHTLDAERLPAFSPDETVLAIGATAGAIRLWSTSDWALRGELTGHAGIILALGFRADGRLLISAGTDRTARIWDVEQLRAIFELPGAGDLNFAAFAPGGAQLYAGGHARLDAWNARPTELDRAELARLVACRVPLRLEGSTLHPAPTRCDGVTTP